MTRKEILDEKDKQIIKIIVYKKRCHIIELMRVTQLDLNEVETRLAHLKRSGIIKMGEGEGVDIDKATKFLFHTSTSNEILNNQEAEDFILHIIQKGDLISLVLDRNNVARILLTDKGEQTISDLIDNYQLDEVKIMKEVDLIVKGLGLEEEDTALSEVDKALMTLYLSGSAFDTDLLPISDIDSTEIDFRLRILQRKGLIKYEGMDEEYYEPNLGPIEQFKRDLRILAFIYRKKSCLGSELANKYNINQNWLKRYLKTYQRKHLIKINTFKGDFDIVPRKKLKNYLKRYLVDDGISSYFQRKGDKLVFTYISNDIADLLMELSNIVKFEGK